MATTRRWFKIGSGLALSIISIIGLFTFLVTQYGFEITDLTGNINCLGTYDSPCISEFQVKNTQPYNVDVYSKTDVKLDFSPDIKDYALFVPDGRCSANGACACDLKDGNKIGYKGWRCVDFTNKTKPIEKNVYVFRFPAYSTTRFRLIGIKYNTKDRVEWSFGANNKTLDPLWGSVLRVDTDGIVTNITKNVNFTQLNQIDPTIKIMYLFDENITRLKAYDYSGNNYTADLGSNATLGPGEIGLGYYTPGIGLGDTRANISGTQGTALFNQSFTVNIWMLTYSNTSLTEFAGTKSAITSGSGGWNFNYQTNGLPKFQVSNGTQSSLVSGVGAGQHIFNNRLYMLTGVYNGTDILFYMNGTLQDKTNLTGSAGISQTVKLSCLENTNRCLNGTIDEFSVYNRSLSQQEIASLYLFGANYTRFAKQGTDTFKNLNFSLTGNENQITVHTKTYTPQQPVFNVINVSLIVGSSTCLGGGFCNYLYSLHQYYPDANGDYNNVTISNPNNSSLRFLFNSDSYGFYTPIMRFNITADIFVSNCAFYAGSNWNVNNSNCVIDSDQINNAGYNLTVTGGYNLTLINSANITITREVLNQGSHIIRLNNSHDIVIGHANFFQWSINQTTGCLDTLNWTNDSGSHWYKVKVRESTYLGGVIGRYYCWHTGIGENGDTLSEGWTYSNQTGWPQPDDNTFVAENYSAINQTLISSNTDNSQYIARAESPTFIVTDSVSFLENTIFLNVTIQNKATENKTILLPVNFGQIILDNGSSGKAYKLIADVGGEIQNFTNTQEENSPPSYPKKISTYSPVSAVWDSNYTIGEQLLQTPALPDHVEMITRQTDRKLAKIKMNIYTELQPNVNKSFLIAYKITESGNWQDALSRYKNFFINTYGTTPFFCPTTSSVWYLSRNAGSLYTGSPTYRWNFPTNISDIYKSKENITIINNLSIANLIFQGGWSMWGGYINNSEYNQSWNPPNGLGQNPEFTLYDPALDVATNHSKINALYSSYNAAGIKSYSYSMPCSQVYGANITMYGSGNVLGVDYNITLGTPTRLLRGNDLRDPANQTALYNKLVDHVLRGATGFYYDAGGCAGETDFFRNFELNISQTYGINITSFEEGSRDTESLRRPQIPIVGASDFAYNNSQLLFWLVPNGSYYRGYSWGSDDLNDAQTLQLVQQGYQPFLAQAVDALNSSDITTRKATNCVAYNNTLTRWNSYGSSIQSCTAPVKPYYC